MNGDLSSGKHQGNSEHVSLSDAAFAEEMVSQSSAWTSPLICLLCGWLSSAWFMNRAVCLIAMKPK